MNFVRDTCLPHTLLLPFLLPLSIEVTEPMNQTRRTFLNQAATTIAVSHLASQAFGSPKDKPRLRLASIGVGGMGAADLQSLSSHQQVDVVALCDVDNNNLNAAAAKHPKAKLFRDFRKMPYSRWFVIVRDSSWHEPGGNPAAVAQVGLPAS